MQRIRSIKQSLIDSGGSTVDGNRLYSILLDARESKVSENMFDVAENLVGNEKDNAKIALEQLWVLKRNMQSEHDTGTVDLLIRFYQDKLNKLRNKEENIKRLSKDSRAMLEDKRKRDSEIASVKQEISDCSCEIDRLSTKLHSLQVKEQELTLIESQLKKELKTNANEIVNGLYEIILTQQSIDDETRQDAPEHSPESAAALSRLFGDEPASDLPKPETAGHQDVDVLGQQEADNKSEGDDDDVILLERIPKPAEPPLPKSVVKTTRGIVIGEYYYDPKAYKNERHYIYNSNFLREKLSLALSSLKNNFDHGRYAEAVQMVQDAYKRIHAGDKLHFEVSTNEILNEKSCKDILEHLKARHYDEVQSICNRLASKIVVLGGNYPEMLREQMKRLSGS